MPSLVDLRREMPELQGLDDAAAVRVLHQAYYPDLDVSVVAKGVGVSMPEPVKPQKTLWQQARGGFARSFDELPGLAAGSAAYVADAVGATDTRDALMGYAERKGAESAQAHEGEAASFSDAWDGKTSWGDFVANAAGYVAGQALQSLATGGLGALAGKALASQGAKQLATRAAAQAIEKGATEEVAREAAMAAVKSAIGKAQVRGAVVGAGASNLNMELGSIYTDAVGEARQQGRELDGGDLARIGASAAGAAAVDTAAEALTARNVFKGSKVGAGAEKAPTLFGSEIAARAAREVPAGMLREAGTEGLQTVIERYGAGLPIADAEAQRDIIDSMAIGAVGGAMGGTAGSLRRRAQDLRADAALGRIGSAATPDEAIAAALEATDVPLAPIETAGPNHFAARRAQAATQARAAMGEAFAAAPPDPPAAAVQGAAAEEAAPPLQPAAPVEPLPGEKSYRQMHVALAALERAGAGFELVRTTEGLAVRPQQAAQGAVETPAGGPADQAPAQEPARAPRTGSAEPVALDPAAPNAVAQYVARQAATNTPAARAFVQDYRAGRITDADVLELLVPRQKPTADQRLAAAAAQAPTLQPGDLLTSDGMPYGTKSAAAVRARKEGGSVIEVPGGWAVRPKIAEGPPAADGSLRDRWQTAAARRRPADPSAAAPAAMPVAGQPIDDEWTAFAPESGTKGVPRAQMPQVKADDRSALVQFLRARGIDYTPEVEVDPATLKPTQAEFSPAKVRKAREHEGGDRSILVSSDGHVVDGHHQWLARQQDGQPVKAIRLDAPLDQLLPLVREFPSAQAAEGAATEPAGSAGPAAAAAPAATQPAIEQKDASNATEPDTARDETRAAPEAESAQTPAATRGDVGGAAGAAGVPGPAATAADEAARVAPAEPAPTKPAPSAKQTRPEELIALRKRAAVLKQLLECLG